MLLSWRHPRPLISSSFSLTGPCHRCHSSLTPVCPSLSSHCPISFSAGWNCLFFGGLFMGGRNTLLLQAASSLSAHHTEHDSPPFLWCWDELLRPSPWGVKIFLLRSLLLELHFKTADRYCVRELPALGRVHKHCVIFAAMRFEVMYQFSPRGMNVSLNAVISRYFFFSTLKTVLEWKFISTKSGSLSYWGWRLKCINCSKSKWVAKHPQKCKYLYFIGHRFHYNGVITF